MELQITALKDGTVIDHLPADKTLKIMELLELHNIEDKVTVAFNVDSKRGGKKGIIKISNRILSQKELSKIAILAEGATVNTIESYKVVEKKDVELARELIDIIECSNAKCITNLEPIGTRFQVEEGNKIRCHYCERTIDISEAIIK